MSAEEYASLLAKLQGNDVDAKIDAVGKLQPLLDTEGFEFTNVDDLLAALKVCLRTANQHLTTATLLIFPSLFRDLSCNAAQLQHEIRFAFTSFLASGGVLDRLGDTRDRARDAAKAALVAMASLAFEHSGPSHSSSLRGKDTHRGPETPMMIFERAFRDSGFGSKIARVREQSIQCLVLIREAHPGFPLRPYVARSVELLEDGDGSVRDAARTAVIALFSAPGVSDGARADLKNEMSKRGVRKTIVDAVLSKLVGNIPPRAASVAGSDPGVNTDNEGLSRSANSTARKASGASITRTTSITSAPGSAAGGERPLSREDVAPVASSSSVTIAIPTAPAAPGIKSAETAGVSAISTDIPPVFIASARDLEHELEKMLPCFQGKETEHNWADRERSTITIRGIIKGGIQARYPDVFIEGLKSGILDGILKALASLRTTLSSHACALLSEMAEALQHAFDPFVDRVLIPLLKMSGFTKKIVAQQSQASVTAIITHTSAQPRVILPLIWSYAQEKNVQCRSYMIEHLSTYLKTHAAKSKHAIETSGGVETITKALQKGLSDPNPAVRPPARICFWTFEPVWPSNALAIAEQLDASARKQLEKANPNPGACTPITPVEEVKKKPSVAAAIAASRAKAKAIATAPPTLRHAVTSPPARRAASPPPAKTPLPQRQSSPRVPSTSRPPSRSAGSPKAPSPSRSPIPPVPPVSVPRPASRTSTPSPPSPTSSSSAHRRQISTSSSALLSSPGRPSTLRSSYSQIRPGARTASNGSGAVPATVPPVPRVKSPPPFKSMPMSVAPQAPASPTRRASSPVTPTKRPALATGSPVSRKTFPSQPLPSLAQKLDDNDSLLHAATVPIPDDDDDESMNLISFSTPFEKYGPTITPPSTISSTLAGDLQEPEESLLAKAIQATNAASQLEDELSTADKGDDPSPYPAELLAKNQAQTPLNRKIMREAALFQDSPQVPKSATILDHLFEQGHENGSWVHKRSVSLRQASVDLDLKSTPLSVELRKNIEALSNGTADEIVLRRLAVICSENGHSNAADAANGQASPVYAPSSPTNINGNSIARPLTSPTDVWMGGKVFDNLFDALTTFLSHDKPAEILDLGLAVLWEMLRHQWEYVTEHQTELWAFLIRLRYANIEQVLQGTNAIRDALTAAVEPVFGLATANGCLVSFLDETPPSGLEAVRLNSWVYGLVGIAKIMMRLPPDILEEEIPRIKGTLTTAICYEQSASVRGAATVAIAACQMVLRDETHLFALLGNLPNDKKNLLTYYFNRTGSRGPAGSNVEAGRVDEELRKIDRGTTLPPRPPAASPRPASS